MRLRQTHIAGADVWSLRQGMSGEIGFELHGDGEHAIAVHQALLDAGADFGVRRLGGRTKMVNHVEACFPTPLVDYMPAFASDRGFMEFLAERHPYILQLLHYPGSGSQLIERQSDRYFDPTELGWIRNIRFDHDFIGRDALEAIVANPRRKMTTLVWDKADVQDVYASLFEEGEPYAVMELPRATFDSFAIDRVMLGDRQVGLSTSRCYSFHFRDMLSLCSIDVDVELGQEVQVIWGNRGQRQKAIRAKVAPAPYKQDKRRVDLASLPFY
jgi:glycine cleavage system aminomethyltransferase T